MRCERAQWPFNDAFLYVLYVYLEHINSSLSNNARHTEFTNWAQPGFLERVPESVTAALGITKRVPSSKTVVLLDEQLQIAQSRQNSEQLFSFLLR